MLLLKRLSELSKNNQAVILLIFVLFFAGFLHGHNSLYYPYFESDEGTYLSQASFVKMDGKLSPYTYWYDHPPAGWFAIGLWADLLGGDWNIFGSSLASGRVFMLFLHLIQISIIFFISKRLTKSNWIAFFVCILYSISPLSTFFQRRVLLDNLMTTWVLVSLALLHLRTIRLRHILMSGFFFGIAVMTKVTAVMFGPAFLYLLLTEKWLVRRNFRVAGWLGVSISVTLLWPIYALIKTEFWPSHDGSKVSLIETTLFQASRGAGVPFWNPESSFLENLDAWFLLDETFVYVIGFTLSASLFMLFFSSKYRFYAMASILYFIFLIRGGIVLGFYILPLLPFLMFVIAGLMEIIDVWFRKVNLKEVPALFFIVSLLFLNIHYPQKIEGYLTVDETSNQMEALVWVKENLPEDTIIMIDIYGMNELLDPGFVNQKRFLNADWYVKVAKDPEIRFDKYRDDWRNIEYILISHEMLFQAERGNLSVVKDAIRNSRPVMRWVDNSTAYVDIQNFISTNGDWAALYKVNDSFETQLFYAWNNYKDNFIRSYGQVVDPQLDQTTSEGQAYAMLMASLMNDKDTFLGVWLWTQHHLQHRIDDRLISWRWVDDVQIDSNNATDADIDIALALLFGYKMFGEQQYLSDAKGIISDIWRQTVVEIGGRHYLLPMEKKSATRGSEYLLNPSYFSPAHYRLFAQVDNNPEHDWIKLADDSYYLLDQIKRMPRNTSGLPPNWLLVNMDNGRLSYADKHFPEQRASYFGFDSFRVIWRLAMDVTWYDSQDGKDYLSGLSDFFEGEWNRRGNFSAVYDLQGQRAVGYSSLAVDTGGLLAMRFTVSGEKISQVYKDLFTERLIIDDENEIAFWGRSDNYYESSWTWLGLALFNNRIPNVMNSY